MRLTITALSKGKEGLVAVKKQVTKNGKQFMQTFYVKPDSTPKGPEGPTQPDIGAAGTAAGAKDYYNGPDGFYTQFDNKAVRIPDEYIAETFNHRGYTFVIARALKGNADDLSFDSDYRMFEASTGLSIGSRHDTPEGAESSGRTALDAQNDKFLEQAISKGRGRLQEVFAADEELDQKLKDVWEAVWGGEEPPVTLHEFQEWARQIEQIHHSGDLNEFVDNLDDRMILESAIAHDLDYEDAETREEAIGEIIEKLEVNYGNLDREEIEEWAEAYEDDLRDGVPWNSLGVDSDYTEGWSGADVVAHAIEENISLSEAQNYAEASVESLEGEIEDEEEDNFRELLEPVYFNDRYGKSWNAEELTALGQWVRGSVQIHRERAEKMFQNRRAGFGEGTAAHDDIVAMVEDHAIRYSQGPYLYRGTGNLAFLEAEIGNVIPYGMSSFSKSEHEAGKHGSIMLIIEHGDDPKNTIVGVDINHIADDCEEAAGSKVVDTTGIDDYRHEQEFLVMAPALVVTRREGDRVWVQPMDMNLVQFMKAMFEDRIARMQRTFNYPLHREPEGAFE